jgi:hypothetical protein
MSLLHPTDDDEAFAAANTAAGWNKAVRRCMVLRLLVRRARLEVKDPVLAADIDRALARTFYDESEAFPPSGWDKET